MRRFQGRQVFCSVTFAIVIAPIIAATYGHCTSPSRPDKNANAPVHLPRHLQFEPPWRHRGDCGPLSLYVLMRLEGQPTSVEDVEKMLPFDSERGCSLADIARAADKLGFATEIRFVNPRDLPNLPFPFILHTTGSLESGVGHFLVVVDYLPEKRQYSVIDTTYETFRSQTEVTVHGSEALVFKGFVSVDERFGAQNGPRLCRNPLISCCSTRERLPDRGIHPHRLQWIRVTAEQRFVCHAEALG
jgi:hypothetical protein